jgi:hypothetical protein
MPPFDKLRRQVRERREPLSALLSCTCVRQFRGREAEPGIQNDVLGRVSDTLDAHFPGFASRPRNNAAAHSVRRCQETSSCFLHATPAALILCPAPPAGTPVATVVRWGGAGASGGGLTWPVARGGSVQGFPCRHYGRCVLDEHIAWRPMPSGLTAPTRQRVSGRSGTDGNRNRRRGAGNRATYNKLRGLASCPASRLLLPWQGAFFETARLRKQGVATMECAGTRPKAEPATAGRRAPELVEGRRPAEGQRAAASDAAREREKTYPTTIGVLPLTRL